MSMGFIVTLNNQTIHEYKQVRIPGRLMRYLGEMDRDMEKGVQLGERWVDHPTETQKQQYVALILFDSLHKNDANLINITSSYLVTRCETLTEINIIQENDLFTLKIQ